MVRFEKILWEGITQCVLAHSDVVKSFKGFCGNKLVDGLGWNFVEYMRRVYARRVHNITEVYII